jgi:antitoxin MazE
MRVALRRMGNSSGVIIPKPLLIEIGARIGGEVEMVVEAGRIVIEAGPAKARTGWAEASQAIAEAEDDGLDWLEFGNADDETFEW